MEDNFKLLKQLVDELNSTNATNEKIDIFLKYSNDPFILKIHEYVYTPFKQYYVTSTNLKKNKKLSISGRYKSIFELLEDLSERKYTGHLAISLVNGFIEDNREYEELIYNIFDRNLKTRFTESLINRIVPGTVPVFNCVLANSYDERLDKVDFEKEEWYASRKLDGIRCLVVIDDNGNIKAYSRNGKEILTINKIINEVKKFNFVSLVIDGELCLVDKNGNEQFQGIVSQFNRKDYQIENPRYKIFDMISLEDFLNKKGNSNFSDRVWILNTVFKQDNDILSPVKQTLVRNKEHLEELREEAKRNGWEGIMIRKNVGYEGKRTNDLLKCKKFFDAEYEVKSVEVGPFRVIVEGKEVTEEVLTNVWIEHKGYPVSVGSGWSLDQRRYYKEHPEELIGNEITVMYFEETKNKQGGISLRFPTVKAIYQGKRIDIE